MRLGLIGLGRIGAFHADTLSSLDAVDELVVTDAIPAAIERIVDKYGATPVASPAELLAAGVDGVVIAAATDAHPQLILAAVESGLPVFCEKPVAKGAAEAAEVLRHCAGARVQIGYNRRFDPGFVAAREAVARGELGWLHTIRSTTMDPAPPPPGYIAGSGGIFRDCSVHDFDIIRFVTRRDVVEVYATGSTRGDEIFADSGDAATATAVLTLDDDTLAVVSNTRYNGRGYDVRLELHGSADSIAVGLEDKLPLRSVEPGATFPAGPPHQFFMDRFATAYRRELAAFTEVVAGTRESPCTVADAVEVGWIAEACTRSLHEHRPVRMNDVRVA
ncbi:MAG TPA: Gfo/Idh/MocA family oxidoreductase [Actinoplanes sp.]|jgi:myo-inositol 2-dehydrogenase/D-chiro-inositol 1-dehydrogenase|nr:Gfo/Idh/MocA family oxidoreductase [Actinoplanes sp.]